MKIKLIKFHDLLKQLKKKKPESNYFSLRELLYVVFMSCDSSQVSYNTFFRHVIVSIL